MFAVLFVHMSQYYQYKQMERSLSLHNAVRVLCADMLKTWSLLDMHMDCCVSVLFVVSYRALYMYLFLVLCLFLLLFS